VIAVVDFGAGNLRNVVKALEHIGAHPYVTDDPATIANADRVVLPGVGAFADCMNGLRQRGVVEACIQAARSGRPFLGICVGAQMLFDAGEEMGEWPGLGILPGRVVAFDERVHAQRLPVPHVGWNQLRALNPAHPLLRDVPSAAYAYFVHSYHLRPADDSLTLVEATYGYPFPAIVGRDKVLGIQFHPEKSQAVGLTLLRNFITL